MNGGPLGPDLCLPDTGNKQSSDVLNNLEKVDDYCEKLEISLVKINDLELVTEYNLGELPALVYYRHSIPILYEGKTSLYDGEPAIIVHFYASDINM